MSKSSKAVKERWKEYNKYESFVLNNPPSEMIKWKGTFHKLKRQQERDKRRNRKYYKNIKAKVGLLSDRDALNYLNLNECHMIVLLGNYNKNKVIIKYNEQCKKDEEEYRQSRLHMFD